MAKESLAVQEVSVVDLPLEETANEIVSAVRKVFTSRGLLLATIDQCVEEEVHRNEQKLYKKLCNNWDVYFRGVVKTEANLMCVWEKVIENVPLLEKGCERWIMKHLRVI